MQNREYANANSLLKKLKQLVLDNLTNEQFGVKELASAYGASRSQLHKKLKKTVGKSVSQFIREIRLQEAMKLLQEDATTVSEIAYQVGFHSPAYFNTCFKDFYGYPPGEAKVRAHLSSDSESDLSPQSTVDQNTVANGKKRKFAVLVGVGVVILGLVGFFSVSGNRAVKPDSSSPITNIGDKQGADEKTIAVLPLKNWSGDPELEYISDGMTDAIITKLAKIESIKRVVPFTSMTAYKNTDKSIENIARELKVRNILQGSFQLAGDHVSIKLQMLDGETEKQFWENEYQRTWKTDEIFNLQAAVAENVAENINAGITDSELKSIQYIPTSNKEAYRLLLQASYQFNQLSLEGFENAKILYERAIALDSTFVPAYLGLGDAYLLSGLVWGMLTEEEAWSKAKPIYRKAQVIDRLANREYEEEVEFSLINGYFYYEWDLKPIEELYSHSLLTTKVGSSNGNSWSFEDYARKTGRFKEVLAIANNFLDDFPTSSGTYVSKACALYFLDRNEEAIDLLSKQDKFYESDYFYLMETAKYYHYLGVQEKSKKQLELFKKHFSNLPPIIQWLDAIHAEMAGNSQKVTETLAVLEDLYNQHTSGSPAWFLALYYCHIKDYDTAFEWLQKSYEHHEVEMTWLKEEPILRPLKNDPRYLELYDKVGFSKLNL